MNIFSIDNLLSVEVVIKPIYKFKLMDVTIWHYALLLNYNANGQTIKIIVNYGPKIPFIYNKALIRFEEYTPKLWQTPRSYFWRDNSTDSYAINTKAVMKRLSGVLNHIEKNGNFNNGTLKLSPWDCGEKYDWNDNNCEHFCSYVMHGFKMSSQYDGFDDGKG